MSTNAVSRIAAQPIEIGCVVQYRVSLQDAKAIKKRRKLEVRVGDVLPATVVHVWSPGIVNLQVALDGSDTYWARSRGQGDQDGQWSWPARD